MHLIIAIIYPPWCLSKRDNHQLHFQEWQETGHEICLFRYFDKLKCCIADYWKAFRRVHFKYEESTFLSDHSSTRTTEITYGDLDQSPVFSTPISYLILPTHSPHNLARGSRLRWRWFGILNTRPRLKRQMVNSEKVTISTHGDKGMSKSYSTSRSEFV